MLMAIMPTLRQRLIGDVTMALSAIGFTVQTINNANTLMCCCMFTVSTSQFSMLFLSPNIQVLSKNYQHCSPQSHTASMSKSQTAQPQTGKTQHSICFCSFCCFYLSVLSLFFCFLLMLHIYVFLLMLCSLQQWNVQW